MFHTTETAPMEYLITELARNLMNQKNIWIQILVKKYISILENISTERHKKLTKDIPLVLWTQREVGVGDIGEILKYPRRKSTFKSRI